MITRRENLQRALRHEVPEWIPFAGHADPYNQPARDGMAPELAAALGTVRWGDRSTVAFSRHLELDIMDWFSGSLTKRRRRVTIEHHREGLDTTTVWHTSAGDLTERRRQCRDDGTSYTLEHLVKGAKDLEALAEAFDDEEFDVDPKRLAELEERRQLIGDDGMISLPLPGTPLGMMLRIYAGVETTAYLYADAPAALRDYFAVAEQNHLRQYRLAATLGAETLIGMDDTSTTTQSPAMFEAFCLDYTDHVAEAVHAAGKLYFHHSCGLIRDLLDLYRQTKMDGVHGLQVPPLGDVTIREAKERLGPGIVIIASANQLFGPMDDWEWVQASVRDMFEGAAPGDNFILGIAGDPTKNMAQTNLLLNECRQYQRRVGATN